MDFPKHPLTHITRPVEAYWQHAEQVVDEAETRGLFVIHSELWYGAGGGLWMHHVKPENAKVYGAFIGKRFARFQNLMWMHAGDRNPDANLAECTRVLAREIAAAAPHHLHTVHKTSVFDTPMNWIHLSVEQDKVEQAVPAEDILLDSPFAAAQTGRYQLWNRVGFEFVCSAFDWRPDDGAWQTAWPANLTTDLMELATWTEVAWLPLGDVEVTAGAHRLQIRLARSKDETGPMPAPALRLDALCLHEGPFRRIRNSSRTSRAATLRTKPQRGFLGQGLAACTAPFVRLRRPSHHVGTARIHAIHAGYGTNLSALAWTVSLRRVRKERRVRL